MQTTKTITDLPTETLTGLLEYLDAAHVSKVGKTCKSLHRVSQSKCVWKKRLLNLPVVTYFGTGQNAKRLLDRLCAQNRLCLLCMNLKKGICQNCSKLKTLMLSTKHRHKSKARIRKQTHRMSVRIPHNEHRNCIMKSSHPTCSY